VKEFVG